MNRNTHFIRDTRGASAVLIALTLFILIGAASLAIDMGQLYTVRNELQNAADGAALAGVGQLIQEDPTTHNAVRDASRAVQYATEVAQTQSQLQGMPSVPDGDRNDLTIHFGIWDIYATDPSQAWTDLGTTCTSDSNANAMRVTVRRAEGLVFGPVTHLFAQLLGQNVSEVGASATAYLGYATATQTGTVTVPLAVPETVVAGLRTRPQGWFAWLFAPREAVATTNSLTFRDLGSDTWYASSYYKPLFDTTKAYLFVVNSSDSIPTTVVNNLKKYYTTGGTAVREMQRGTRLYPLSEYQWAGNIKTIFQTFKNAYDAEKDTQTNKWRVMVPVYSTTNPLARKRTTYPWHLVRRLLPGVTDAQACFKFWSQSYPGGNVPIYVDGFANVDITNVTYNSGCVTSGMPDQITNPDSCRNTCSVSVEVSPDQDTVSPPGSVGGGPDNGHITPGGQAKGAVASMPRLVD